MIKIDSSIKPADLQKKLNIFWKLSGEKISSIEKTYDKSKGAPVFTIRGKYTSRGWTEWTQGFQYGSALLQFDATNNRKFLELGRQKTVKLMAPHLTHFGVHDHGFNNISTYGNLWRLMNEKQIPEQSWERAFYELALNVSGAVQARRWTRIPNGGFIHSFNGPHSLFADTIRSLRSLAVSHQLGHVLMEENDRKVSLLERLIQHALTTAKYAVYYGEGRDAFDVRGRVAHESIFNLNDGNYRCPNSQQGFSPFTTWTRGLAWIICGYAEQLEFIASLKEIELEPFGGRKKIEAIFRKVACATADFYIANTPTDGIPYWDTGAPGLSRLGDYLSRPADPFNDHEPVDSSAAAITAQGLLRLGHYLGKTKGQKYYQAGLTVLNTLLDEPYLSTKRNHQGLILHSIYHKPNGWDYIPQGRKIPCGESSMWGDYHAREVALYVQRLIEKKPYLKFRR
ncbi:MAG: glycosyl hydrolase [Kiritimatiellae bacterium]|nr:glycosyl hydrolase [Kiritimatiellia bacterium]MDD5519410.1 glycosyl hydrolase [Kiritimatiellia bacterium]